MSNIFVEGFALYGLGNNLAGSSPQIQAMLAGRWASMGATVPNLGTLPWDPTDTDIYFSAKTPNGGNQGARFVLPSSTTTLILSLYYAMAELPLSLYDCVFSVCDGSNVVLMQLGVGTTGALYVFNGSTTIIAQSGGPVLVAESAAHIEASITTGANGSCAVTVQVNGTTVIAATSLTFTNTNQAAQVRVFDAIAGFPANGLDYIGNLIARNTAGSVNNGIVGDRRVATLFVNADDLAHQGWTGHPLKCFGVGILDLTETASTNPVAAVTAAAATSLDIGSQDFTIEGMFRFLALPSAANKAELFSKWSEPNNDRCYELFVGGPSLEAGNTVFRISTDGTAGGLVELISFPYQWDTGTWHHVAVARSGTSLRLFINGVQQGLTITDANTYHSPGAGGDPAALGGQWANGIGIVNNTGLYGWQDEFRLTIGACRYTSNFSPPVAPFPRGSISDPDWSFVSWISGWDSATIADESAFARTLTSRNAAVAVTPDDGVFNFQTIDKAAGPPLDITFIEADLLAAMQTLTYTALPTTSATITLGTKNGSTPAVYTWDATTPSVAFHVLKGATIAASMANLAAAINAGAGAGVVYGTGTTANHDASASVLADGQLIAAALLPGAAGNSIVSTSTDTNGAWGAGTLTGGQDIPSYSQFSYAHLPSNVSLVDSLTIVSRDWKTDAGTCTVQASFVGSGGGVASGANNSVTTTPTFYADTIETDPDTSGPLTPTTILNGKMRVDRTA